MIIDNGNDVYDFYFKVNNSKLNNDEKLNRQVNKVINRIHNNYNIEPYSCKVTSRTNEDDYINNIFRIKVSVKIINKNTPN